MVSVIWIVRRSLGEYGGGGEEREVKIKYKLVKN